LEPGSGIGFKDTLKVDTLVEIIALDNRGDQFFVLEKQLGMNKLRNLFKLFIFHFCIY
jgi:hypothetical protein